MTTTLSQKRIQLLAYLLLLKTNLFQYLFIYFLLMDTIYYCPVLSSAQTKCNGRFTYINDTININYRYIGCVIQLY